MLPVDPDLQIPKFADTKTAHGKVWRPEVRTFKFIAIIAALVASGSMWASESLAQGFFRQSNFSQQGFNRTSFQDHRFSVEFGAKAYDRPGDDLGLPIISDGVTNEVLFDSENASDLGSAGGAEVKFNFTNKRGRELELRTVIVDWEETSEIGGANLVSSFFPVAGAQPDSIGYDYDSDFFSIELVTRRAVRPGFTVSFGPRIVSTKDFVEVSGSQDIGGVTFTQIQTTEATNILLGLQGGLEFNLPLADGVRLQGFTRLGGYTNPSEVNIGTVDPAGTVTEGRLSKQTGSFLGEVGGRLYVDILPNTLSGYVGYEATWIDGLAVAPAQILSGTANGVDTANTIFFNAATIGLRMTY